MLRISAQATAAAVRFAMGLCRGFAILELLVIIFTLVILLKVAVPHILDHAAGVAKAKTDLNMIQEAVVSYYAHQHPHAYPPTSATVATSYLAAAIPQLINGPVYDSFSTQWAQYNYQLSANGKHYVLWSLGPNANSGDIVIDNKGTVSGKDHDDICITNGQGC